MKKVKDLVVKIGTYTTGGQEKTRWKTIGALMEGDSGQFLFLDRSFNPAGVPFKEGSESIIVSMFDVKDKVSEQTQHNKEKQNAYQKQDEEIPF